MRSAADIKKEIEEKLGFFPPFFAPALVTPGVLESLWRQTLTDYVENPIPHLFKEKLAALLARYCSVPYCLLCHSSALRPLGLSALEIRDLLESPSLSYAQLKEAVQSLGSKPLKGWPEAGSPAENSILVCCIAIFLNQDTELCQQQLRSVLEPSFYQYLCIYISYNRMALNWAEMHPELSFNDDQRVRENLRHLVKDEPKLRDFFANYQGQILAGERTRLYSYLAQAPIGFAVVEEPEHRFVMANRRYEELIGKSNLRGHVIRDVHDTAESSFFEGLDRAYATREGYIIPEKQITVKAGDKTKTIYVSLSIEPFRGHGGEVAGLLIVLNEVTDQVLARQEMLGTAAHLKATQEELNIERHRLSDILNQMPVGVCLLEGPNHIYTYVNNAYREFVFVSDQIIGLSVRDAFPELNDSPIHQILKNTYETGERFDTKSFPFDLKTTDKGIQRFYLDFSYEATRDINGKIYGIAVTVSDVSSSVEARQKIEESESQFRAIQKKFNLAMKSAHMATWTIDLKTNEVTTSDTMKNVFGPDFATGNVFEIINKFMHPDDRDEVNQAWQYAAANQLPYMHEFRIVLTDGTVRWVLSQGGPSFDTDNQMDHYFSGILFDITEKKISEIALVNEQHKLETLFKQSPVAMALYCGPDFIIEKVNTTYLRMSGQRDFIGKKFVEAFPELSDEPFFEILKHVFATGEAFEAKDFRTRVIRKPGGEPEESYWDFTYARTKDSEDKPYGVYFVGNDVTDRVHAHHALESAREAADRANEAKSSFLANMSHEIRTPLGAIMGYSDLLKADDLSRADILQQVSVIERNSAHLLRIVDDILDLAKVEAGKMLVEKIEFSLAELIADFIALMGYRARDKGIGFELHLLDKIPQFIISDPTRIRQILANVVGNAVKFTERGHVELNISFAMNQLTFEVKDTGPGISKEQIVELFQPFHQADVSTTRKFGGSGLGLVLTRRLTELLGGDFVLKESSVGRGSTFVARIQVDVPKTTALIGESDVRNLPKLSNEFAAAAKPLQGMNILVVEDSPDNQALFTLLLTKAGASVKIAEDGIEGVKQATSAQFDVVLMDVQMPRMDGHEATSLLRAQGYKGSIIALTAHAMVEERARASRSGFTDFLTKPLQRNDLFQMLKKYRVPEF